MDLYVKGQHGDQDIMKSCIVCMMRLIWSQQLGYPSLDGQDILYERKVIYHVRKSPWISRRVESEWKDGWMDGLMRDAERLGVRNWRSKAKDRDSWEAIT
jgi:hypothetical protein